MAQNAVLPATLPSVAITSVQFAVPPGTGYEDSRAQLLSRLQLTAEQISYWQRYETKLDAYSKLFYSEKPAAAYASEGAPRQFARLTDSFQNRLAALEQIEDAAKELYSVLNPRQQDVANQSLIFTVPTFASASNCVPTERNLRNEKRDSPQHARRGGGMGGINASGGGPSSQIPIQY